MCHSTQWSLCSTPMVIHQNMWIQWLLFKNLMKRSMTQRWPLTPFLLRSHVWLYPRIIVSKSNYPSIPWKYIQVCGYSDYFSKYLTKRSVTQMTPTWPLTPLLLRSHVQLYPQIIVSNCHKNTSKHVDTVTLFSKTLTKGQWPLDDLWPHFCWGHMCGSTQGSSCPSPMGIHQCMWIQWSILQNIPLATYYIYRRDGLSTEWVIT